MQLMTPAAFHALIEAVASKQVMLDHDQEHRDSTSQVYRDAVAATEAGIPSYLQMHGEFKNPSGAQCYYGDTPIRLCNIARWATNNRFGVMADGRVIVVHPPGLSSVPFTGPTVWGWDIEKLVDEAKAKAFDPDQWLSAQEAEASAASSERSKKAAKLKQHGPSINKSPHWFNKTLLTTSAPLDGEDDAEYYDKVSPFFMIVNDHGEVPPEVDNDEDNMFQTAKAAVEYAMAHVPSADEVIRVVRMRTD